MKRFTSALTRMGIGAVTVATVGMGLPLLTASPAAAAINTEQLQIVPVSAANNAVDNGCQEYRVTAHNMSWDADTEDGGTSTPFDSVVYDANSPYSGQTINVILNPSAGLNSQFCDLGDGGYVSGGNQGAGLPDQGTFTLDSTDSEFDQDYFEFGINEANVTPGAGSIGVQAYVDDNSNNQVNSGEPQTSATDTILAGNPGAPANANQQDDITDTLTATPLTRNAASDASTDYVWFKLTSSHGNMTTQGVDINLQITDKQGDVTSNGDDTNLTTCESGNPDFESQNDNSGEGGLSRNPANDGSIYDIDNETDGAGVAYCYVNAPPDLPASGSHAAQTGPYTLTWFVTQSCAPPTAVGPVENGTCNEPTATTTLNTYNTPTNDSSVRPTCGGGSTARNSPKVCFELPKAQSETFTAQAIDDVNGRPEVNTLINWGLDYYGECDKYTHNCELNNLVLGFASSNTKARSAARPSAKGAASPNFSEADNWTGTGGTLTRYYRAADDSIGVATMPEDCVTDSSGTCTVTLHLNKPAEDGATFGVLSALNDYDGIHSSVYGGATDLNDEDPYIGGNDCNTTADDSAPTFYCGRSVVEFSRNFTPGDTNIHVTRSAPSTRAGHFLTVTGHITNQFGNPITYQDPVTFHVINGVFANGTTQQVVQSDDTGRAQVAVTKLRHGKARVTAVLGGGSEFNTQCGTHAGHSVDGFGHQYYAPGARAGNCQASTTLHFHGKAKPQVERPHLSAGNVHHHRVKLTAKTNPTLTHAKVKFYRKTVSGLKKLVGADRTDSNGVAKSRVRVHGHHAHKYVCKVTGLNSLFKSKFSNKVIV